MVHNIVLTNTIETNTTDVNVDSEVNCIYSVLRHFR